MAGRLSGVGGSARTFSPTKWREDLATILDTAWPRANLECSLAEKLGFGGALALAVAANDDRVRGVATFAAPAHLAPWCRSPEEIHRAVQISGVVGDGNDLLSPQDLYRDILAIDPMGAIAKLPPRRLLIGHGSDDIEVPASDARDLVAAADGRAELRLIQGAGHQLRADPRMVATLLGWLDRHR